jgi:hypothetical protein
MYTNYAPDLLKEEIIVKNNLREKTIIKEPLGLNFVLLNHIISLGDVQLELPTLQLHETNNSIANSWKHSSNITIL